MASSSDLVRIAALAGDPGRAAMLDALMDGRALTATELSRAVDIAAQTAISHLAQLTTAELIAVEKQGRRAKPSECP